MGSDHLLCWTDVSLAQTRALVAASRDDCVQLIRDYLQLPENDQQSAILRDMYLHAIQFCKSNKFEHDKTSVTISILKRLHTTAVSTPFDNMDAIYEVCQMNWWNDFTVCRVGVLFLYEKNELCCVL